MCVLGFLTYSHIIFTCHKTRRWSLFHVWIRRLTETCRQCSIYFLSASWNKLSRLLAFHCHRPNEICVCTFPTFFYFLNSTCKWAAIFHIIKLPLFRPFNTEYVYTLKIHTSLPFRHLATWHTHESFYTKLPWRTVFGVFIYINRYSTAAGN